MRHLFVSSQQWKHWNHVWSQFKVNNKDTIMTLLKSLWRLYLLTLNRFYLLFWCFRSWLWTSKSRLRRKGKIELMFVILQNFTFKGNPFTLQADEAFYIGSSPATESYLVMEKILNVAKLSGAQVPLFRQPLLIGSPFFFYFSILLHRCF